MDVEGNDSRERGDGRLTFEHRAALFSLALSDCVVVNMWYNSLGNYTASSYGLLKTVMEVNVELFLQQPNSPRTVLLFVVRDWTEHMTPLARMENKIYCEYIQHIWVNISKPEKLGNAKAEDFFQFEIVGLPHAMMMPNEFETAIRQLRKRWYGKLRPVSYSRQIPADGFGVYCASVWNTIINQSQLDIPSQKEMLSTFRCQEIKSSVLFNIRPALSEQLNNAREAQLPNFRCFAEEATNAALKAYYVDARRYQKSTCERVGMELVDLICVDLQKIVDAHLSHKQQALCGLFTLKLKGLFTIEESAHAHDDADKRVSICLKLWKDFMHICDGLREETLSEFNSVTEACEISINAEWLSKGEVICRLFDIRSDGLEISMYKDVSRMRENQLLEFQKILQTICGTGMKELPDLLLSKDYSYRSFSEHCTRIALEARTTAEKTLLPSWKGLTNETDSSVKANGRSDVNENSDEAFVDKCGLQVVFEFRKRIEILIRDMHSIVMERFQMYFNYDEDMQPRQWQNVTTDKLKQIFTNARDRALLVLECIKENCIDINKLISEEQISQHKFCTVPLLTLAKYNNINNRAIRAMQTACRDAQFIQATGGNTSWRTIPVWFWGLLLALGWNELCGTLGFFLFSPTSMILLVPIIILSVAAVLLGQASLVLGFVSNMYIALKAVGMPIVMKTLTTSLDMIRTHINSMSSAPSSSSRSDSSDTNNDTVKKKGGTGILIDDDKPTLSATN